MFVAVGLVGIVMAEEGKEGADAGKGKGHRGCPDKAEMMKKFDKDGDGKLSDAEKAEMKKEWESKKAAHEAEMLKKFDKDGDGKLSEAEKEEMMKERKAAMEAAMLKKFDKDGDGKLSDTEKAEMEKAMKEHHKGMKKGDAKGCGAEKKEGV